MLIQYKIGVALGALLISTGLAVGLTWTYMDAKLELAKANHSLELKTIEAESERIKGELISAELSFERRIKQQTDKLDKDYEERIKGINRSVANLAGIRLRDPNGDQAGSGSAPGNPGIPGGTGGTCASELSESTSQFLLNLAASADKTREQLIVCKGFLQEVRDSNEEYRQKIKKMAEESGS